MGIHISLGADVREKLKLFSSSRKQSMSKVIETSLEKLFEEESLDFKKHAALSVSMAKRFMIPRGYKLNSFYSTLYMLANKYPDASSKEYWGPMVYLDIVDKTHSEIQQDIAKEYEKLVRVKKE